MLGTALLLLLAMVIKGPSTPHCSWGQVLEEVSAQAPQAKLVLLSLPPLQPLGLGGWELSR